MYENIILIPYRKREKHLDYFIKNTVPLIREHLPNSKVVVVEQNEGKGFNRGKILNVGFKEYENKTNFFITHDVDINPNKNIVINSYTRNDKNIYKIKNVHASSLGCIVKFKHNIIFDMNGFPNDIWGWGIEDRALYYRSYIKNFDIENSHISDKCFNMLFHPSNAVNYTGEKKKKSDIWQKKYIDKLDDKDKILLLNESGLNNLDYTIIERKQLDDIVELIKVDI